jgi:hypothetical protein
MRGLHLDAVNPADLPQAVAALISCWAEPHRISASVTMDKMMVQAWNASWDGKRAQF